MVYRIVVHAYDLRVDDKIFYIRLDSIKNILAYIRILGCHVFEVSRVDCDLSVMIVNLPSQTIVFVLAREWLSLKSSENNVDVFCRLCEHRFARNAWGQLAISVKVC